jgi:hypothetical protein
MSDQFSCFFKKIKLPEDIEQFLKKTKNIHMPTTIKEVNELALGGQGADEFVVSYDVPHMGSVQEATVHRCRNGVAVNYIDPYVRRRDPDTMVVADDLPTDKPHFKDRFSFSFSSMRQEIFSWLSDQSLVILPFYSGDPSLRYGSLLIGPANASFFAAALANMQTIIDINELPEGWQPKVFIFLAPSFRYTHCKNKQVVVHNRGVENYEIFSLNLYPGPSAKKGIYGALLHFGEQEGWLTTHSSTVRVTTPYDNEFVIMHEGASGGGKSEMLQYPQREPDGRLIIGENIVTGKKRYLPLFQGCSLNPVTDDMALCPSAIQNTSGRLVAQDAEQGWFVRVNHIDRYGVDRYLEEMCTNPPEPIVFLNIYSVPRATCLIWEHIEDEPGKPCSNPRVILPKRIVPGLVSEPVEINVRSFGIRTPPCTASHPSYGIAGLFHILPPALAWIWRLVSPRGYDNPSITQDQGMSSEGVGSFWPFAAGKKVNYANLLLRQIVQTPRTRYVLCPNQYIGSWKVGFMPQWIAREYLSRRGNARFRERQIEPSRCSLLGFAIHSMQIEGFFFNREFMQVDSQPEVGTQAYDQGAKMLKDFFKQELKGYLKESSLDPLGRQIIECCLEDGQVSDYAQLIKPNADI